MTDPNTVPLTCPHCDMLASYAIPPTLVTCVHCGETAHVTYYGTRPDSATIKQWVQDCNEYMAQVTP